MDATTNFGEVVIGRDGIERLAAEFRHVHQKVSGDCRAQTTQFAYQGRLADTGAPANGQFDFQFKLFDTPTVAPASNGAAP